MLRQRENRAKMRHGRDSAHETTQQRNIRGKSARYSNSWRFRQVVEAVGASKDDAASVADTERCSASGNGVERPGELWREIRIAPRCQDGEKSKGQVRGGRWKKKWKTVGQTATLKKTRSHNESNKTTLWIPEERRARGDYDKAVKDKEQLLGLRTTIVESAVYGTYTVQKLIKGFLVASPAIHPPHCRVERSRTRSEIRVPLPEGLRIFVIFGSRRDSYIFIQNFCGSEECQKWQSASNQAEMPELGRKA
ncbi:hypothetical protein B0H14DRAFT_2586212 [Mycena olivaceomarginata]|nr:hypothetical protein B0H14DRAFT_2586212 [Mycena olivaceomarginata]